MDAKSCRVSFIFVIVGVFMMTWAGNVFAGGCVSVRWGENSGEKECSGAQIKHKHKGGPPSHAPAHGYRAKHQYRYYPACKVYHDLERGLYFYLKGENWEVSVSLPTSLRDSLGEFVSLELETDKPFLYHSEHEKQFSEL
jgi:hypothetical protein